MNRRRSAVITGAAGGLGAAFARRLAREGYDLLLTDSNSHSLNILVDELSRNGSHVRHFAADLANDGDVDLLVDTISRDEDIKLLINNAGFGLVCKFQSVEINRVIDMVRVHITSSLRLCRAVLPQMIKAGDNAGIINVASAGAFTRFPRDASYIASKAYMIAFTECLALDLVGTSVHVQALCPAWIATEFTRGAELAMTGLDFMYQAI
jgi:short-subunit dehydrogenase